MVSKDDETMARSERLSRASGDNDSASVSAPLDALRDDGDGREVLEVVGIGRGALRDTRRLLEA